MGLPEMVTIILVVVFYKYESYLEYRSVSSLKKL